MAIKLDIKRCFEILELDTGATAEEAKKAYRDLVSIWHPDRVSANNPRLQKKAAGRLKEINAAYDMVLSYLYAGEKGAPWSRFEKSSRPSPTTGARPETESMADSQPGSCGAAIGGKNIALLLLLVCTAAGLVHFYGATDIGRMVEPQIKIKRFQGKKGKTTVERKHMPAKIKTDARKEPHTASALREKKTKIVDSKAQVAKHQKETSVLKQKEIDTLDNVIAGAERQLKSKSYLKSKRSYEAALKLIEAGQFQNDRHVLKRRKEIAEALKSKDIVYGSKGFIKYKNKWIAPDEYQKHFVTYRGRIKHYKELKRVITQITDSHVRLHLLTKYGERMIHKKKVECYRLVLKKKNTSSTHFTVFYRWEVWTFKSIDEGDLSLDIVYHAGTDQWQIGDIHENDTASAMPS